MTEEAGAQRDHPDRPYTLPEASSADGAVGHPHTPAAPPSNAELAGVLREMGDLLEIRGEQPFRVGAYRRAAGSVHHAGMDVSRAYRDGRPPTLPGVGPAISEKLAELAATGRLGALERLRDEVPRGLLDLLAIPGIGPRTARDLWLEAGVTSVAELGAAARDARLERVRGLGPRARAGILEALAEMAERPPRRMHMAEAHGLAARVRDLLAGLPDARAAHIVGSVRRWCETVGDIDIVLETEHPERTLASLAEDAAIARVMARDDLAGAARVVLRLRDGPSVDVMVVPPGRAGAAIVHLTGSAAHNVRLRQRARALGWSLSEHGVSPIERSVRADAPIRSGPGVPPGSPVLPGAQGSPGPQASPVPVVFEHEADVYAFLGLPVIAPELREDRGEIEAALEGRLPALVEVGDLQGDVHSHSDWSDGREPVATVAEAARARGYGYLVLTDHSAGLAVARGLTPARVEAQRRVIGELNERFAREEARGEAPPGAHPDGFRLLQGCELEITLDGRLDHDDRLLASLDVVVASLHVGRRQPRAQLMTRYAVAMRSPHVDIVSHPSGRKIGQRPELDLDWDAFFALAAETGTVLEINGSDERLDLDEHRARAAHEAGCRFVVDSDAHWLDELENVRWGTAVARRAWLTRADILNTLGREAFRAALRKDR